MGRKNILLASGDSMAQEKWRRTLRNWRYYYDVSEAASAERAWKALKTYMPDLMVLDSDFPEAEEFCGFLSDRGKLVMVVERGDSGERRLYWLKARAAGCVSMSEKRDIFEARIGALLSMFPLEQ